MAGKGKGKGVLMTRAAHNLIGGVGRAHSGAYMQAQ